MENISIVNLYQLLQLCPLPVFHSPPALLAHENFDSVQARSAVAKTFLCYHQYSFGHKSKTQQYTGCYEEN